MNQIQNQKNWSLFDALACPHPMLTDIYDWMLPPFTEGDFKHWVTEECKIAEQRKPVHGR